MAVLPCDHRSVCVSIGTDMAKLPLRFQKTTYFNQTVPRLSAQLPHSYCRAKQNFHDLACAPLLLYLAQYFTPDRCSRCYRNSFSKARSDPATPNPQRLKDVPKRRPGGEGREPHHTGGYVRPARTQRRG